MRRACIAWSSGVIFRSITCARASALTVPSLNCATAPWYTLAVLSPAYLESNFTELESVLAEHLGLELSQRRLLIVRRAPCEPRLGLRARLWLDMTSDEEVERNLPRLVAALREPSSP